MFGEYRIRHLELNLLTMIRKYIFLVASSVLFVSCHTVKSDDMMSFEYKIAVMDTLLQSYGIDIPQYYGMQIPQSYTYGELEKYKDNLRSAFCKGLSLSQENKRKIKSSLPYWKKRMTRSVGGNVNEKFGNGHSLRLYHKYSITNCFYPQQSTLSIDSVYVISDHGMDSVQPENIIWNPGKSNPPFIYDYSFVFTYHNKRYRFSSTTRKGKKVKNYHKFPDSMPKTGWTIITNNKIEEL